MLLSRKIARGALLTALGAAIMYMSGSLPTAKIGLCALAGLLSAAAVVAGGYRAGFLVYGATALLSWIILPHKDLAMLYTLFFGIYPMVKSRAERIPGRIKMWAVKLVFFNVVLVIVLLLIPFMLVTPDLPGGFYTRAALVYLIGHAVFIVYDIGFSQFIALMIKHIGRFLND